MFAVSINGERLYWTEIRPKSHLRGFYGPQRELDLV